MNTLGSFVFDYAADKQTDRQTDSKILPTPTDIVGVGNEKRKSEDRMTVIIATTN